MTWLNLLAELETHDNPPPEIDFSPGHHWGLLGGPSEEELAQLLRFHQTGIACFWWGLHGQTPVRVVFEA